MAGPLRLNSGTEVLLLRLRYGRVLRYLLCLDSLLLSERLLQELVREASGASEAWSLGWVSAIHSSGRTIWIVDAHGYGKRLSYAPMKY